MASKKHSTESGASLWSRLRKPVISVFIFFYIYSVGLWLCPSQKWRNVLLRPVRPIILYSGLWQSFTVFCPNPRKVNLDLDAIVKFDDGSKVVWKFPRMDKLGQLERIQKSRYRKFGHSYLNWKKEKVLWPDFARYVARIHSSDRKKPVRVTLQRHWAYTPPPEKGLGKPAPEHSKSFKFFVYKVKPGDLQ